MMSTLKTPSCVFALCFVSTAAAVRDQQDFSKVEIGVLAEVYRKAHPRARHPV